MKMEFYFIHLDLPVSAFLFQMPSVIANLCTTSIHMVGYPSTWKFYWQFSISSRCRFFLVHSLSIGKSVSHSRMTYSRFANTWVYSWTLPITAVLGWIFDIRSDSVWELCISSKNQLYHRWHWMHGKWQWSGSIRHDRNTIAPGQCERQCVYKDVGGYVRRFEILRLFITNLLP